MPRKRYEEEIEEILENMDPEDERGPGDRPPNDVSEVADDAPKEGQLVSWDEVPEKPKRRRPSGGGRRRGGSGRASSFVMTPTRLVVGAVIVVVIVLATSYWPLLILALILFGGAYALNKRKGGPGLMSAGTIFWLIREPLQLYAFGFFRKDELIWLRDRLGG